MYIYMYILREINIYLKRNTIKRYLDIKYDKNIKYGNVGYRQATYPNTNSPFAFTPVSYGRIPLYWPGRGDEIYFIRISYGRGEVPIKSNWWGGVESGQGQGNRLFYPLGRASPLFQKCLAQRRKNYTKHFCHFCPPK